MAAERETEEDAEDDAGGERRDVAVGSVKAWDESVAAGLDLVDLLESERFAGHDVRGCARCVVVAEGEVRRLRREDVRVLHSGRKEA